MNELNSKEIERVVTEAGKYEIPQITDLGLIKDKFEDSFDIES
jgi:hypothetical protein